MSLPTFTTTPQPSGLTIPACARRYHADIARSVMPPAHDQRLWRIGEIVVIIVTVALLCARTIAELFAEIDGPVLTAAASAAVGNAAGQVTATWSESRMDSTSALASATLGGQPGLGLGSGACGATDAQCWIAARSIRNQYRHRQQKKSTGAMSRRRRFRRLPAAWESIGSAVPGEFAQLHPASRRPRARIGQRRFHGGPGHYATRGVCR